MLRPFLIALSALAVAMLGMLQPITDLVSIISTITIH